MLVLSRKAGESVVIDSATHVVVIAVKGRYVQLGFEAPRGLKIVREEILNRPPRGETQKADERL